MVIFKSGDGIRFEWDERKADANYRKHGISFEASTRVFTDANRIDLFDSAHSFPGEDRYISIGMAEDILCVVYTERRQNIRLISARMADRIERRMYYGQFRP